MDLISSSGFSMPDMYLFANTIASKSWMYLVTLVFSIICYYRIFLKAGRRGWEALIPFYNQFTLYKITWGNGWLSLIQFLPACTIPIPIFMSVISTINGNYDAVIVAIIVAGILALVCSVISLVFTVLTCVKLTRAFGLEGWFAIGLLVLSPLFLGIIAFGKAQYFGIGRNASTEDLS